MTKRLSLLFVLGLALLTVPSQTGCGGGSGSNCSAVGQSCLTKSCCPRPDGTVRFQKTFSYPNNVQTVTSCTCL